MQMMHLYMNKSKWPSGNGMTQVKNHISVPSELPLCSLRAGRVIGKLYVAPRFFCGIHATRLAATEA